MVPSFRLKDTIIPSGMMTAPLCMCTGTLNVGSVVYRGRLAATVVIPSTSTSAMAGLATLKIQDFGQNDAKAPIPI